MEAEQEKLIAAQERKEQRASLLLPLWGIVLALSIVMVLFSVYFFGSIRAQLFAERQSHLIEMTNKVSNAMNTTISAMRRESKTALKLVSDMKQSETDELFSALDKTKDTLALDESVLLVFDDRGKFYTSEGKYGTWSNQEDLLDGDTLPKIRDVDVGGSTQTCAVFMRELDKTKPLTQYDSNMTHVALAVPLDALKDTFTLSIFGDQCYTYLVDNHGRRLYKQTNGAGFIEDYNVLATLKQQETVQGGTMDDLSEAIEQRESFCLEFMETTKETNFFVSTVPILDSDWTVLIFVPTQVLGANTAKTLNLIAQYACGIGLTLLVLCSCMLYTVLTSKSDRKLLLQQEENNRKLAKAADEAQKAAEEAAKSAEEARNANAAKSEFLSHMSHDIRTPINGIIGMTNIAVKEVGNCQGSCPRVQDCLQKISGSADHLLSLVNDVLDMSHIESGKLVIAHAPMDLRTCIDNCASIITGQLLSRNINFVQDFGEMEHPMVLGDELHLRQVFINILGNAVKFTPDEGTITFSAHEISAGDTTAHYRFSVRDTGVGMSEEFQKKIFEAFSQEDNGSRTNYKGTGLGMTISKQFVDMMGGTLSVQSKQGEGSCFTVDIDMTIDPDHQRVEPDEPPVVVSLKGMKVLLVEDNELNMEIAQELLEDEDIVVTTAENGKIAFDTFTQSPPGTFEAILMDVMMPVMNGLEATKAIRASDHPEAKTIPIIAMTANAYAEDISASLAAGMNEHVAKPIDFDRLLTVLSQYRKDVAP